ncbi:MAG: YbaK/EbsC family protein [Brevefilum sp.]|nr:YbaK/EbsC family protein [Brevefilum sp.]
MTNTGFEQYPPGVHDVLNILLENHIPIEVRVFDSPARQASQAAALIGCTLGAIVKSLVFEKQTLGDFLLVLVSGQNRADLEVVSQIIGDRVRPAPPATVLEKTGYPVGAVPPIGVKGASTLIMDADLMLHEHVWASAGAENILIKFDPADLLKLSDGKIENIKIT